MINVLVVHEFPLMCNIIASVLDNEPDIKVSGCASSVESALELVLHYGVDLVLVSTRLPEQGTIRLMNLLAEKAASVKILILGITELRHRTFAFPCQELPAVQHEPRTSDSPESHHGHEYAAQT